MDKKVIFAVAGSGKTTYIINSLSLNKRSLIITYTIANFNNLARRISEKFDGVWPDNITLMTFFQFLYRFCCKPFLADDFKLHSIIYDQPPSYLVQSNDSYFITSSGYLYSNRISLFVEKQGCLDDVKNRIATYFDELIIDEVQDIAGRDFNFLEHLLSTEVNMLFVGDFYQHTFDTSRDGNVNKSLFDCYDDYVEKFTKHDCVLDDYTLCKSWRCGREVCEFVTQNLSIQICSHRDDCSFVHFISDNNEIEQIIHNSSIIKLHYKDSSKFGNDHKNWGETKGEDCFQDVCVLLNKTTMNAYKKNMLHDLPPSTRNKLYVALTRAHGNVYLIDEKVANDLAFGAISL